MLDESFIDNAKWVLSVVIIPFAVWFWRKHEKDHEVIDADRKELWKVTSKLQESTSMGYSKLNDRIMDHIDERVNETRQFVVAEDVKLMAELGVQRGHIDKLFDKMEENNRRSEDRHVETLNAIHSLATTMHQALATKADK